MTIPTNPYVYIPNTLAQSAQVNGSFNAIYAWANGGVDDSNVNHLVGFYASTITATTANQGKFGTNPVSTVGFQFIAPSSGITPLTISGVGGQSVDIFDVTLTSGGTKALAINSTGSALFNGGSPFVVIGTASGNTAQAIKLFSSAGFTDLSTSIGTVANVTASALLVDTDNSTNLLALDRSGNLALLGNVISRSNVTATGLSSVSAVPGLASGDVVAQRSSTTGRFSAGGSSAGTWDYNILNANAWTAQNSSTFADIFAGVYHNSSDASLKSNIVPLATTLQGIMALKPSTYTVTASGKDRIGVIAQDVQAVFPMLVATSNDGLMAVDTFGVTIALLNAFQEYVLAHP